MSKYRCITCDQTLPTKARVLEHRRDGHQVEGISVDFACDKCDQRFHTSAELRDHSHIHKRMYPSTPLCPFLLLKMLPFLFFPSKSCLLKEDLYENNIHFIPPFRWFISPLHKNHFSNMFFFFFLFL